MKTPIGLAVITLLPAVSSLSAATLYVSPQSTNSTPPYATWDTAATNIQQAVGVATAGDQVVVTNGVYPGSVVVNNPLTLLSVNGPEFTIINGGGAGRCAFLTHGASLSGFTLTNGRAGSGGGVYCPSTDSFLTNCVIAGNSAFPIVNVAGGVWGGTLFNCTITNNSVCTSCQGGSGGGAYSSILYNCTLSGNLARGGSGAQSCTLYNCTLSDNSGSGAHGCALYNCTLSGNSGGGGAIESMLYNCRLPGHSGSLSSTLSGNSTTNAGSGGAYSSTLFNCVVYSNAGPEGANYDSNGYSTLNYCCTTPLPANGVGNITNAPLFVDYASGNLRLQSNSPCINAGNNAYVSYTTDLDGNPRIVSGTVDIGAYEFQGPGSVVSYAWLQQYGLPTDGSADFADPDRDGMNNWQEWICGTDPTNSMSVLTMLAPSNSPSGITVPWQSVSGKTYFLERSTNLDSPFASLVTNITGQADTTSYTDTNALGADPFFYRVGIQH